MGEVGTGAAGKAKRQRQGTNGGGREGGDKWQGREGGGMAVVSGWDWEGMGSYKFEGERVRGEEGGTGGGVCVSGTRRRGCIGKWGGGGVLGAGGGGVELQTHDRYMLGPLMLVIVHQVWGNHSCHH